MLLIEANHVVPVDRLVDAVWDESPPSTARSQVQICVSALRRALAAAGVSGQIVTRAPGYLFQLAEDDLDLRVFDRLGAAGRARAANGQLAEASATFRRALALWRGPPLAGVTSRVVGAASVSLTERRLALLEEAIDIELQLGRHHEAIGELMVLAAEQPARERLRALLMTALYRDGRQTEALEVYQRGRQALIAELGLEPGRELQQLHRAILARHPELDLPGSEAGMATDVGAETMRATAVNATAPFGMATPHLLPSDISDFTGHDLRVREIRAALLPASGGAPPSSVPVVTITGSGGTGKTTIAVHVAHRVSHEFRDGQLYVTLRGGEARPVSTAQVLERFLRALGVPGSAIPEDRDERAEMYRDRLSGRRVLVVLDDAASEEQILPLLPGGGDCAVLVTGRVRLTRLAGAQRVHLDLFGESDAIELLAQVAGRERVAAEPEAAGTVATLCGNLPLALRIAAARLAARPHWTIAHMAARLADERHRLDELRHHGLGIRSTISVAYEGLEWPARRLFRRLGMLETPDFSSWVSIPLLGVGPTEVEDLLESLVDIQLLDVEQVARGGVRYRFHELIRVFARERLKAEESPAEQHEILRRVLGAWLHLAKRAHQRQYGGDYTVLHGGAEWPLPESVTDELIREPLEWYEAERVGLVAAVGQAADAELDDLCWDIAMSTVTLFEVRSYLDDWRETHEIALAAVRRGRNRRGEAAMLYSLGSLSLYERRLEDATERLTAALDSFVALGEDRGRGLAQRNLAYLDRLRGDVDSAVQRYEEAIEALRRVGDVVGQAHVLTNIAQVYIERFYYDEAEQILEGALKIAQQVGARRVESQALHRLGESYLGRGDLARAGATFRAVLTAVHAEQDQVGEAYNLHGLGTVQIRLGRYAQAEQTLALAHQLAGETGERLLLGRVCLSLAELAHANTCADDAEHWLDEAERLFDQIGATLWRDRAQLLRDEMRPAADG
jgi:DNA-binding SARP family transcriptional activator/Tfp pilus assembly protein PilF